MITQLGTLPLSAFNPAVASAIASATATISATLPGLTAQVSGAALAAAGLVLAPPNLATQLVMVAEIAASITLAISLGVPSVSVQLDAVLELIVALEAQIAVLEAQLSILVDLGDALLPSVEAWTYAGPCNKFGSELQGYTGPGFAGGGPNTQSVGFVIGAVDAGAIEALGLLYGI